MYAKRLSVWAGVSVRACACAWPGSQKKRHACSLTCGNAKVFTRKFYKMMAMLAETFVFLYMGMAMFSIEQVADSVAPAAAARSEPCPQSTDCIIRVPHLAHNTGNRTGLAPTARRSGSGRLTDHRRKRPGVAWCRAAAWCVRTPQVDASRATGIVFSILIVLFSRTFNIYPLTALINLRRSPEAKIDKRFQFVMWFSGLRGAIAFALALEVRAHIVQGAKLH